MKKKKKELQPAPTAGWPCSQPEQYQRISVTSDHKIETK